GGVAPRADHHVTAGLPTGGAELVRRCVAEGLRHRARVMPPLPIPSPGAARPSPVPAAVRAGPAVWPHWARAGLTPTRGGARPAPATWGQRSGHLPSGSFSAPNHAVPTHSLPSCPDTRGPA